MRVIKFRAWDLLEKKMLGWGDIFHLPSWEVFPGTPEQRAFEVMQYSGLEDKNGREIYEGDILKDSGSSNGIVFYKNGGSKVSSDLHGEGSIRNFNNYDDLYHDLIIDNAMAVIGNIYENPELLGDSK